MNLVTVLVVLHIVPKAAPLKRDSSVKMQYEDLKAAWQGSRKRSRLFLAGWPTEAVDIERMERKYAEAIEPPGGQAFHVGASLEFCWRAAHRPNQHH